MNNKILFKVKPSTTNKKRRKRKRNLITDIVRCKDGSYIIKTAPEPKKKKLPEDVDPKAELEKKLQDQCEIINKLKAQLNNEKSKYQETIIKLRNDLEKCKHYKSMVDVKDKRVNSLKKENNELKSLVENLQQEIEEKSTLTVNQDEFNAYKVQCNEKLEMYKKKIEEKTRKYIKPKIDEANQILTGQNKEINQLNELKEYIHKKKQEIENQYKKLLEEHKSIEKAKEKIKLHAIDCNKKIINEYRTKVKKFNQIKIQHENKLRFKEESLNKREHDLRIMQTETLKNIKLWNDIQMNKTIDMETDSLLNDIDFDEILASKKVMNDKICDIKNVNVDDIFNSRKLANILDYEDNNLNVFDQ